MHDSSNDIAVWVIVGESSNSAGGGVRVVYAYTKGRDNPPDPDKAIEIALPSDDGWYVIYSISLLGTVSPAAAQVCGDTPLSVMAEWFLGNLARDTTALLNQCQLSKKG